MNEGQPTPDLQEGPTRPYGGVWRSPSLSTTRTQRKPNRRHSTLSADLNLSTGGVGPGAAFRVSVKVAPGFWVLRVFIRSIPFSFYSVPA